MGREKIIRTELSKWKDEDLITEEQFLNLSARYSAKESPSMVVLFSILGSLFVGGGVILLLARNWSNLPLSAQSFLSFLPMAISQGICIYVFKRKFASAAWREGAALFNVLSVFASLALVGRVFHLPSDIDMYFTVCALLGLPLIYLFRAVSPLLIYLASVIAAYFGQYNPGLWFALLLWVPVLPFILYKISREQDSPGGIYTGWVHAASFLVFCFALGSSSRYSAMDIELVPWLFICFTLFYCIDLLFYPGDRDYRKRPYLVISVTGTLILMLISTVDSIISRGDLFPLGCTAAGECIMFALIILKKKIRDSLRLSMLTVFFAFSASSFLTCLCSVKELNSWISIILLLLLSIIFIVKGIARSSYTLSNLGMFLLVLTAVIQFFNGDYSFIVKGLAFILTGIGFFAVNILVKKQKGINHESQ